MSEFREEMYEVIVWGDNHHEHRHDTYASLTRARDAVRELRELGFETEIYKLTVYEELIEDE
jgi:hypothetical protein